MTFWPRSLQGQLAIRLSLIFIVSTAIGVGLLLWQGSEAADSFGLDMLRYRAAELARYVVPAPGGGAMLKLPPELSRLYSEVHGPNMYAIRVADRRIFSSNADMAKLVAGWKADTAPDNFRLEEFGDSRADYYGITVRENSAVGPISVVVAHASDADAVAAAMLKAFASRVAWMIPILMIGTLLIGAWSIRAGLRKVSAISKRATEIDTNSADVRLPLAGLPTELVPLVHAVNLAFDRLQEGFAAQRRFTANAAHELRTPLTMLTAGLDELADGPSVVKLRTDVARMNRLVNQLLRVARLDAVPVNISDRIDLGRAAAEVVEYLAPWIIAQQRSVALESPENPVFVRGNGEEIADAIRNIVENAVLHTPAGTEVTVSVRDGGLVIVEDKGPGIPLSDRPYIFARFWRGKGVTASGAGLGLSIVAEIVRMHGGTIQIGDALDGGASFSLKFPLA